VVCRPLAPSQRRWSCSPSHPSSSAPQARGCASSGRIQPCGGAAMTRTSCALRCAASRQQQQQTRCARACVAAAPACAPADWRATRLRAFGRSRGQADACAPARARCAAAACPQPRRVRRIAGAAAAPGLREQRGALSVCAAWQRVHDAVSGKDYFWDTVTGQTAWELPGNAAADAPAAVAAAAPQPAAAAGLTNEALETLFLDYILTPGVRRGACECHGAALCAPSGRAHPRLVLFCTTHASCQIRLPVAVRCVHGARRGEPRRHLRPRRFVL
jgi:hypothetical protein